MNMDILNSMNELSFDTNGVNEKEKPWAEKDKAEKMHATKNKRTQVINFFKQDGIDNAPYAYKLWPEKSRDEDDKKNARSLFAKCLHGEVNDSGNEYSFSDSEINTLYSLMSASFPNKGKRLKENKMKIGSNEIRYIMNEVMKIVNKKVLNESMSPEEIHNAVHNMRSNELETANGVYYVDYDPQTNELYAGPATNAGIAKEYSIEFDASMGYNMRDILDNNLQELADQVFEGEGYPQSELNESFFGQQNIYGEDALDNVYNAFCESLVSLKEAARIHKDEMLAEFAEQVQALVRDFNDSKIYQNTLDESYEDFTPDDFDDSLDSEEEAFDYDEDGIDIGTFSDILKKHGWGYHDFKDVTLKDGSTGTAFTCSSDGDSDDIQEVMKDLWAYVSNPDKIRISSGYHRSAPEIRYPVIIVLD